MLLEMLVSCIKKHVMKGAAANCIGTSWRTRISPASDSKERESFVD